MYIRAKLSVYIVNVENSKPEMGACPMICIMATVAVSPLAALSHHSLHHTMSEPEPALSLQSAADLPSEVILHICESLALISHLSGPQK